MRRYETIFILRPSLNEEEITAIIDRSSTILTAEGGKIIELDKWGMKKLAYPIKKEAQGFYIFCDYCSTPDAVSEMERRFRLDDAVLRYMTIKLSDGLTDEEITEATALAVEKQAAAKEADAESEEDSAEETATVSDAEDDDETDNEEE